VSLSIGELVEGHWNSRQESFLNDDTITRM